MVRTRSPKSSGRRVKKGYVFDPDYQPFRGLTPKAKARTSLERPPDDKAWETIQLPKTRTRLRVLVAMLEQGLSPSEAYGCCCRDLN